MGTPREEMANCTKKCLIVIHLPLQNDRTLLWSAIVVRGSAAGELQTKMKFFVTLEQYVRSFNWIDETK